MALTHEVKLILSDGSECKVWDRYTITVDMLQAGSAWTFSMWRSERTGEDGEVYAWQDLLDKVKGYDHLSVTVDGYVQLCGVIEERKVAHKRGGAGLVISGRDTSALALECDADPKLVQTNVGLTDALASLFNPIGVPFRCYVEKEAREARQGKRSHRGLTTKTRGHRVKHGRPRVGEKIWQIAEKLVRQYGFMIWTAPTEEGVAVVVDVPDYDSSNVFSFVQAIEDGRRTTDSNILEGELSETVRGVPTVIRAFGRGSRGNTASTRFKVEQVNSEIPRYGTVVSPLPNVVKFIQPKRSTSTAHAQQECVREQNRATRDWRSYTATVQGHGQEIKGQMVLYAPNTMASVRDDVIGLDESMLITHVEFSGEHGGEHGGGQTTKLKLGSRDAIQLTPEDESAQ